MSLGVEAIAKNAFGIDTQCEHYEQHHHFSIYDHSRTLQLVDKIPHGRYKFVRRYLNSDKNCARLWPKADKIQKHAAAIACGGPNIVKGVSNSAEMSLMFKHMYGAFHHNQVPVIDLAIGSCYPLSRIPSDCNEAFSQSDQDLLKQLFSISKLTTVRDPLAKQLCTELGHETKLVPCAALCSGPILQELANLGNSEKKQYILLNFQESGANQDWGQDLDKGKWKNTITDVLGTFEKDHKFVLICHSAYELKVARREFPHLPSHFPQTPKEYAQIACRATAGIASRIHCAIPLAGMGIPSVVFGTDTRLNTVRQMGLPTRSVFDANADWIKEKLSSLISNLDEEKERLTKLRTDTFETYRKEILKATTDV